MAKRKPGLEAEVAAWVKGKTTPELYQIMDLLRVEIRTRFDATRCEYLARIKAEKALKAAKKCRTKEGT
jgi:hypothetical protein